MKMTEVEVINGFLWIHINPEDNSSILCLEKMFGRPCPICDYARKVKASEKLNDGENQNES